MKDLISVVVPIYNTGKYLEACIKSIVNQDYPNLEIIMVDDGSKDPATIKICDELVARYNNVSLYRKANGGLSSARNYGIKRARGKYIGFVDSDDIIEPNMYSTLYSMICRDGTKIAICGIVIEENGKSRIKDEKINSNCYVHKDYMHHFLLGHWHSACTNLYEASLFRNCSFPEGEVNEDYILNFRIYNTLEKISITKKPLYHYIRREASITSSPKNLKYLDWIKHTKLVLAEIQGTPLKMEAEYQYLHSNIVLANSSLLTLGRVKSDEAEQLYKIVTKNLSKDRKMLHRNVFLSRRYKLMSFFMAYFPSLYRILILTGLKIKKIL